MPLTQIQRKVVQQLDAKAKQLWQQYGDDSAAILVGMVEEMPKVKLLLDQADRHALDDCAASHPDFYRFMKLLENVAQGISSGEITVPK